MDIRPVLHSQVEQHRRRVLHHFGHLLSELKCPTGEDAVEEAHFSALQAKIHIENIEHSCRTLIQIAADASTAQTLYGAPSLEDADPLAALDAQWRSEGLRGARDALAPDTTFCEADGPRPAGACGGLPAGVGQVLSFAKPEARDMPQTFQDAWDSPAATVSFEAAGWRFDVGSNNLDRLAGPGSGAGDADLYQCP